MFNAKRKLYLAEAVWKSPMEIIRGAYFCVPDISRIVALNGNKGWKQL